MARTKLVSNVALLLLVTLLLSPALPAQDAAQMPAERQDSLAPAGAKKARFGHNATPTLPTNKALFVPAMVPKTSATELDTATSVNEFGTVVGSYADPNAPSGQTAGVLVFDGTTGKRIFPASIDASAPITYDPIALRFHATGLSETTIFRINAVTGLVDDLGCPPGAQGQIPIACILVDGANFGGSSHFLVTDVFFDGSNFSTRTYDSLDRDTIVTFTDVAGTASGNQAAVGGYGTRGQLPGEILVMGEVGQTASGPFTPYGAFINTGDPTQIKYFLGTLPNSYNDFTSLKTDNTGLHFGTVVNTLTHQQVVAEFYDYWHLFQTVSQPESSHLSANLSSLTFFTGISNLYINPGTFDWTATISTLANPANPPVVQIAISNNDVVTMPQATQPTWLSSQANFMDALNHSWISLCDTNGPATGNGYAFCGGNPANERDPFGLSDPVNLNALIPAGSLGTGPDGGARKLSTIDTGSGNGYLFAHDNYGDGWLLTPQPLINCPSDVSGTYTGGNNGQPVNLGQPTVTDVNDPAPVVTNNAPALFLQGVTRVTWTATDTWSNSRACVQVVGLFPAAGTTPTLTALSSNLNPSTFNQPVTFTATITPQGGGAATGTVNFNDGPTLFGSATVIGNAAASITSSLSVGTHSITATYSGDATFAGSTSAPVSQVVNTAAQLVSISVTPVGASIPKGLTLQFKAAGTYSDSSTQDITGSVNWTSSNPAVATIAAGGLAMGAMKGKATMAATLGSISGSTTLTVTAPVPVAISVTPANPSIPLGTAKQVKALGTYTDGSKHNLTSSVIWNSGTPTVATISAAGLATSVSEGTSVITASLGSISGFTTLTVKAPALVSIGVIPANASIAKGTTQQFTATGTYTDNSTQDLTLSVKWSSSLKPVATIAPTGLATAVGAGQTTIKAVLGKKATTSLTVTP